jgi:diaminopimelate epimerase
MTLKFTKMHGCGNDYIYFNCFENEIYGNIHDPELLAVRLSDRHTGIGGDGIVLILSSDDKSIAAQMRMFNADGSEGAMCGNAIRCVAKFLYDNGICAEDTMNISTKSGVKHLLLNTENGKVNAVVVDMGLPALSPEITLTISGAEYEITRVSMGNPHAVVFCNDISRLEVSKIGPQFEHHETFQPDRVNTEFIEVLGRNLLKMRVWERGSGETLACGTGACAAAVAAILKGHCDKDAEIEVQLPGGSLFIRQSGEDNKVYMTGGCVTVFQGTVDLNEFYSRRAAPRPQAGSL